MGHFQVENRQVEIFFIWIQYARSQKRLTNVTGLGRPWTFPIGSICQNLLVWLNFALLLVLYYDLFKCFDIHYVSRADLENYWVDYILHIHDLVVPLQVFTPRLDGPKEVLSSPCCHLWLLRPHGQKIEFIIYANIEPFLQIFFTQV